MGDIDVTTASISQLRRAQKGPRLRHDAVPEAPRPVAKYADVRLPVPRGAVLFGARYGPAFVRAARASPPLACLPTPAARRCQELEQQLAERAMRRPTMLRASAPEFVPEYRASTDSLPTLDELSHASLKIPTLPLTLMPTAFSFVIIEVRKFVVIEVAGHARADPAVPSQQGCSVARLRWTARAAIARTWLLPVQCLRQGQAVQIARLLHRFSALAEAALQHVPVAVNIPNRDYLQ